MQALESAEWWVVVRGEGFAMPKKTGELYAYLFITGVKQKATVRGVVSDLRTLIATQAEDDHERPIVFAAEVAGAYRAIAVVAVAYGDLEGLHNFLAGEEYEGIQFDWDRVEYQLLIEGPSYMSALARPFPPKRPPGCDVLAFVRISAEAGRAREVLGRLGDELGDTFHGAAIVFGGADILLTLDAPDLETVAQVALANLQSIPGITGTETSFADVQRYAR